MKMKRPTSLEKLKNQRTKELKNNMKAIKLPPTRCGNREWVIVLLIISATALISCIPFIIRYYYAREANLVYLGNFFSVTDINSYFSKILQAKNNPGWMIFNRYTTETHQPILVFIFWISLGKISKILSISQFAIFQFVRIICPVFFLLTFYWFTGYFIKNYKTKLYSLLLLIFATGISGLFYEIYFKYHFDRNLIPPDFWGIDQQPIWRFFLHPHIALGMALTLISIILIIKASEKNKIKLVIYCGFINLIVAMIAPHHFILFAISIFFYWLFTEKINFRYFVISIILGLAYLAYLFDITQTNTGWSILYWQKYCSDIAIWKIFMGHGILMILLIYFSVNYQKIKDNFKNSIFIIILLLVIFIVGFFAPLEFSNRFLEFVNIPLAIIGGVAFYHITQLKKEKILEKFLYFFIIAILIFNNLSVIKSMSDIKDNEVAYIFIPKQTYSAIKFLDKYESQDYNILSSALTGNYLPTISPNLRTFYGHMIETVDDKKKAGFIVKFYKNELDENQARDILEKYNIDYILYSVQEQKINPNFEAQKYGFIEKIYDKNGVIIYKNDKNS